MDDILIDPLEIESAVTSGYDFTTVAILVVGLFAVFVFVVMVMVVRKLVTRPDLHGLTREQIKKKWEEIERISGQGIMGTKMGIVEADKLLDGALKSIMMPGDTMGERLKVAGYKYPELKKVWYAHKLRNQIVHETTFEISERQGRSALHEFKKALKVINVL
jgi:hypothetical protein